MTERITKERLKFSFNERLASGAANGTSLDHEEVEEACRQLLAYRESGALEALRGLLSICKPMREEWLSESAFVDACRTYENAKTAMAKLEAIGE